MKVIRWDDLKISCEMQKASAFYVVFVLLGVFWLLALAVVPVKMTSSMLVFASSFPVLIAEFVWLLQDSFVRETMKSRDRLIRTKKARLIV